MVRDYSTDIVKLALSSNAKLAADIILNKAVVGNLDKIVGVVIQRFSIAFATEKKSREYVYEALIEMVLNLIGIESIKTGFSDREKSEAMRKIRYFLKKCEILEKEEEKTATEALKVVQQIIGEMKQVMIGNSMVAKMAVEISGKINENSITETFLSAAEKAIVENVYYHMVSRELTKLGNDSATGLRWVRHLGAVQVSSNPVIAARAYEEFPHLWKEFKTVASNHKEWFADPDKFGDEIALEGTIVSLLPNLHVFRPIFLLSDRRDGLVSYQINPYKAASFEETFEDASKIYLALQENLERIDPYFWNDQLQGMGRPNVVFKIAGCGPSALMITETLNKMGIGTNNTVTYTVSQEVCLILAAMKGMAEAAKVGIPLTQIYETNMIGRLEDHLREATAEDLLRNGLKRVQDKEKNLTRLAEQLGVLEEVEKADSLEEKITIVCSFKYLKSSPPKTVLRTLTDKNFAVALANLYGKSENVQKELTQLEEDIRYTGIYITRKVYWIFFAAENKAKWIRYIVNEHGVSEEEARDILNRIDLLPASKRRAEDTYLVLGKRGTANLTNTEFPSQQMDVWTKSRSEDFKLSEYEGSILNEADAHRLENLLGIVDFRKSFCLTPSLAEVLKQVGVRVDFEKGGLEPEEWSGFGPVKKTLDEFQRAYADFRTKAIEFVRQVAREHQK